MNNLVLVTFLCLAAGWMAVTEALKCESCGGSGNKDSCADPYTGSNAVPCPLGICQKIKYSDKDNNMMVVRSCIPIAGAVDKSGTCEEGERDGKKATFCYCKDKDSCNGSSIPLFSAVTITFGVVLSYLVKY